MQKSLERYVARVLAAGGLGLLSACGGVKLGGNALDANLPPAQAQACREAVAQALLNEGISPQAVKNIEYQAIGDGNRYSSTRIREFQAWVYPRSGGAWLVVLSQSCQVRDVRMLRGS